MRRKREALIGLFRAIREEKVDRDIIDLLMLINSIRGVHTTSSCSGRVGILEEPALGAKPLSRWLLKKHGPITFEEAKEALRAAREGMIFLKSQPPIFHIVAADFEVAKKLHELGLASGFKYTTFKAVKGKRVLVEINGTEYLTSPLGKDGKVFLGDDALALNVEVANEMLTRSKSRLPRLYSAFERLRDEFGEDDLFYEIKRSF